MIYPKCWDTAQVRTVLTTESRQKARGLFLQTHRPFQRIRVDFCKDADLGGRFISEDQVRTLIENGPLDADNRLFFVTGEAGCGKSELCQWLEYTVDSRNRLVIHVPRGMTSAAHVAALLQRNLGMTAGALRRTPHAIQANYVALAATVLLYEQTPAALVPITQWEHVLGHLTLRRAIAEHLEAADCGDYTHRLLADATELEQWLVAAGASDTIHLDRATQQDALHQLLAQALEQTLWLGDLRVLLGQLSSTAIARGVRPLLLIEDITAFRSFGDRLLDYLLDLTSGHFDAVIGITTGFERTQLARATVEGDLTHIHHRLRARFVLTDEHGHSYGLEEDIVALTQGYLTALRRSCASCVLCTTCDNVFGARLYPFTETMLRRALSNLVEEGNSRQTPRLFLEHVLGAVLLADEPPPITLDRSAYLISPPVLFRSDTVSDDTLRALLRWYGEVGETAVSIDPHIPAFWNIPCPTSDAASSVQFDRTYIATTSNAPSPPPRWEEELRELQHWLAVGGRYPSREMLKRGIERALLMLGDPRTLASRDSLSVSRAEIYYSRGDERIPIYLDRDSGDQPSTRTALKVCVEGSLDERTILEELAYCALSGTDLTRVSRNVARTLEWTQTHWDRYHTDIRTTLRDSLGGLSLEQLVLITWQLLEGLTGAPTSTLPDLHSRDVDSSSYASLTPWLPEQHGLCFAAGEQLVAWHETVRRLFIGCFTLRDNLIDSARYHAAVAEINTVTALHPLAALPLPSLRSLPFSIRPTGEKLYPLLAILQRYANALQRLDVRTALVADSTDLAQRAQHLVAQRDLDWAMLQQQLPELRWRCAQVGVVWRESYDGAIATLSTLSTPQLANLEQAVLSLYTEAQTTLTEHAYSIWEYQRFRHRLRPIVQHPYWVAQQVAETWCTELTQGARQQFRRSGRMLSGTREYHALLDTSRIIQEELRYA